jgi:endonuclease/exonuclease/phosphatase family metal-dependent hydrolase
LNHQVGFLKDNLTDYDFVGVGRDDGISKGEFAGIFYLRERFEILDTGNFWLSETPDIPSKGWDAKNIRIVTWARLYERKHNKEIYVFNTHFDPKGKTAQEKSSQLLVQKAQEIAADDAPIFLTGDFNMLIGNPRLRPIIKEYYSAQRFAERSDSNNSYNVFGKWTLSKNIDFIFYKNAKALSYNTVVEDYGVRYISDHYPIVAYFNYQ